MNYSNSQRAGVILYPTAVLFHYIFYLFYKFWQIVRHKIFFKVWEHILKEQQIILCYVCQNIFCNTDKRINHILRSFNFQSMNKADTMQAVKQCVTVGYGRQSFQCNNFPYQWVQTDFSIFSVIMDKTIFGEIIHIT